MVSLRDPLVSVVTPVYNGESHLRECIESVLAQTYTNWDYTIVNNCSTDRTLEVAQEYAAKDSRIRIHDNETFTPVMANHNIALRQISPLSVYCKVVFADDWIFPECIEKMVRLAEQHPSVAIVGAYGYGFNGTKVVWDGLPYPSTVVTGRELCRASLLDGPHVFGTPTSVLYRSDVVRSRHSFYNESNLHADTEACLEFLEHSDFGFVHQVLTYTRAREDSLTSYSRKFNTYLPFYLYALMTYGPRYLTDKELKHMLRKKLGNYYKYLGYHLYRGNPPGFWKFHSDKLAALGYPLSKPRLVAAAMSHALDLVFNPKRTAEQMVQRLRRVVSRSSG